MADAAQTQYDEAMKTYNTQVALNKQIDGKIADLSAANADLQKKKERLETAKSNISTKDDEISSYIELLSKGPNTEQFSGQREHDYWTNKKTPLKTELQSYKDGIEGGGESIVTQIQRKINELSENINNNQSSINFLAMSKTNPVAPTKP